MNIPETLKMPYLSVFKVFHGMKVQVFSSGLGLVFKTVFGFFLSPLPLGCLKSVKKEMSGSFQVQSQ
jgi:hypothetical protein